MAKTLDALKINERLYKQLGKLLDDLEDADNTIGVTIPQRIAALKAIGSVQLMFMSLRKEESEISDVGSAVRAYSRTFQANADAAGRRAATAGRSHRLRRTSATAELEHDDEDTSD